MSAYVAKVPASNAPLLASEEEPQKLSCKERVQKWQPWQRICFYIGIGILVLVIAISIRHFMRGSELQPFLKVLTNSRKCKGSASCEIALTVSDSNTFDLHPAENALFGFLSAQLIELPNSTEGAAADNMAEILKGAHVEFVDPSGEWHKFLISLPGAYKRISSHESDSDQYGIDEGRVINTILIGTLDGKTWLQLEGSAFNPSKGEIVGHTLDAIEYVITRRNVGPLGISMHTDKNSLELEQPKGTEVCADTC